MFVLGCLGQCDPQESLRSETMPRTREEISPCEMIDQSVYYARALLMLSGKFMQVVILTIRFVLSTIVICRVLLKSAEGCC